MTGTLLRAQRRQVKLLILIERVLDTVRHRKMHIAVRLNGLCVTQSAPRILLKKVKVENDGPLRPAYHRDANSRLGHPLENPLSASPPIRPEQKGGTNVTPVQVEISDYLQSHPSSDTITNRSIQYPSTCQTYVVALCCTMVVRHKGPYSAGRAFAALATRAEV